MAHLQDLRAPVGHVIGATAPTHSGTLVDVDVALLDALVDVAVTAERLQAIARAGRDEPSSVTAHPRPLTRDRSPATDHGLLASPGVGVLLKAQSVSALLVSLPFGIRESVP